MRFRTICDNDYRSNRNRFALSINAKFVEFESLLVYLCRVETGGWCASSVGGGVPAVLGGVSVMVTLLYSFKSSGQDCIRMRTI